MYEFFRLARSDGERRINWRLLLREHKGQVEVLKDGELYAVFAANDREFRKAVIIQLARIGAASFRELCSGFEIDRETLERYLIQAQERGFRTVVDDKPGPKGPWKADQLSRLEVIKEFVNEPGISDAEIARRVSARRPIQVDRKMVSRILRHAGLKPAPDADTEPEEVLSNQLPLRFKEGR
jgi:transposase